MGGQFYDLRESSAMIKYFPLVGWKNLRMLYVTQSFGNKCFQLFNWFSII